MIHLRYNDLSVTINEKGAELQSILYNNLEYLWQADEKYWGKHAPVLFPIIGELKDGKYIYKDKEYRLPRHGFARDKTFKKELLTQSLTRLSLQSDNDTMQVYPFPFTFQIEYRLDDAALHCTFKVINNGNEYMYFSAGGHPAFNVPLVNNLRYEDYYIEFSDDEELKRYTLQNGLVADDIETINLSNRKLLLQYELFYKDAIVLKHINSNILKLASNKNERGLQFTFNEFQYLGIWAAKDAPFVCLEPWCGVADSVNHDNQLVNKEGINCLAAGKSWQRVWSVQLF